MNTLNEGLVKSVFVVLYASNSRLDNLTKIPLSSMLIRHVNIAEGYRRDQETFSSPNTGKRGQNRDEEAEILCY